MKINCIAIDDEPLALNKIREYIKRIPYLELLESFDNAISALEFIKEHRVDLIFLDIQMEELTGIQMVEAMNDAPKIILTTAYSQYAIKSYELDVSDYLLKPISFPRFLKSCEKISDQLKSHVHQKPALSKEDQQPIAPSFFYIKNGHKTQKIDFKDIYFIEAMKDYVRIWTHNEKVMTLLSLKKLESLLPSHQFIRIHKSYIISMDKIDSIERNRVLILQERLAIGKSYQKSFFDKIEQNKIN